jgi:hypothetical protein
MRKRKTRPNSESSTLRYQVRSNARSGGKKTHRPKARSSLADRNKNEGEPTEWSFNQQVSLDIQRLTMESATVVANDVDNFFNQLGGSMSMKDTVRPSSYPTMSPQIVFSQSPTLSPQTPETLPPVPMTKSPTKSPVISLSETPTILPETISPTAQPINSPTLAPVARPSEEPTTDPSILPSSKPVTMSPTSTPVNPETLPPTKRPSLAPVTQSPSDAPTQAPITPTENPTVAPTQLKVCDPPISMLQREEQLLALVNKITPEADVLTQGTAYNDAFNWLVNVDSAQVCPGDELDVVQRYIMAVNYFILSGDNWAMCNAETAPSAAPCSEGSQRHLSGANVCQWFNVTCDAADENIVAIELGTFH